MTDAERVPWERLRGGQVLALRFRRQQVIAGFIVDFYCHAARLVVEVDGSAHAGQEDYDVARDTALTAMGLRMVRFTNDDVQLRLDNTLARLAALCRQE
ncbi:MAG: endonuclease domain-containing protein [Ktedonobacterales bacterium]